MANVTVTITVKADGKKVAKRKVEGVVTGIESGATLRDRAKIQIDRLASELRQTFA